MDKGEKKQEVELRAVLNREDWDSVYEKLMQNFTFLGKEKLTDFYFCKNEVKTFDELEMVEIGSYSLRLRKSEKDQITTVDLNTKVITQRNDHNSWTEHETLIGSFDETCRIIEVIGFKVFFELSKTRYSFSKPPFTVVLEEIDNFGPIIEVEIITDIESANSAKEQIKALLSKLGVLESQIVAKSVTNLLMKKLVKF